MFRDRVFGKLLFFSFVWHIFWLSAVDVIVAPPNKFDGGYQEVDFLGPILEKTAFDVMLEEMKVQSETLYSSKACFFLDKVYLKAEGPKRTVLKEFLPDSVFNRFMFNMRDCVKDKKEAPFCFAEDRFINRWQ